MASIRPLIGAFLRQLREKNGMTQVEVGTKLGVNHVVVCHYETGRVIPSYERLQEFANLYHVDMSVFGPEAVYRHWRRVKEKVPQTEFAECVKAQREKLHMTQEEVAAALGVTKETIDNYETGKCQPKSRMMLSQLSKILCLDPFLLEAKYRKDVFEVQEKKWCQAGEHMMPLHFFHRSSQTKSKLHSYCKFCRERKRKEKLYGHL